MDHLRRLLADTASTYPELTSFLRQVDESLSTLTNDEIRRHYFNGCSDWEVLTLCAYQSLELNIEHSSVFIDAVFRQLKALSTPRTSWH